jgi:hypothetical protein
MSEQPQFTQAQVAAWLQYESIRSSGLYNMFDPKAQQKSGLTNDEYRFSMKMYSQLKEVANNGQYE